METGIRVKRLGMNLPKDEAKTLKMVRVGPYIVVGRTVEAFEGRIVSHRGLVSKIIFLAVQDSSIGDLVSP